MNWKNVFEHLPPNALELMIISALTTLIIVTWIVRGIIG